MGSWKNTQHFVGARGDHDVAAQRVKHVHGINLKVNTNYSTNNNVCYNHTYGVIIESGSNFL